MNKIHLYRSIMHHINMNHSRPSRWLDTVLGLSVREWYLDFIRVEFDRFEG